MNDTTNNLNPSSRQSPESSTIDHCEKEVYWRLDLLVRLELLVGHLSDLLSPTRQLVDQLRLRSNASHTTRCDLQSLNETTGSIWTHLGTIAEEIKVIKTQRKDQE